MKNQLLNLPKYMDMNQKRNPKQIWNKYSKICCLYEVTLGVKQRHIQLFWGAQPHKETFYV